MDQPVKLKLYKVSYRMECFVEAIDEDEAIERYSNGKATVSIQKFINIEKVENESLLSL